MSFGKATPYLCEGLLPLAGVVTLLVISWGYVAYMAWGMDNMEVAAEWWLMPRMINWHGVDVVLVFGMWAIMMAAEMRDAVSSFMQVEIAVSAPTSAAARRCDIVYGAARAVGALPVFRKS